MTTALSIMAVTISALSMIISLLSLRQSKKTSSGSNLTRFREELQAVILSFQREWVSRQRCQSLVTEAMLLREALDALPGSTPTEEDYGFIDGLQGDLNRIGRKQEEDLSQVQLLWRKDAPDLDDLGTLQRMAVIQQRRISFHEDNTARLERLVKEFREGRAVGQRIATLRGGGESS